jgi:hypothetical protein
MTVWYVHRNDSSEITYAGEFQEGYSEEALDDATNQEIKDWLVKVNAPSPPPTPAEKLAAAGLTVADLKALLGLS